MSSMPSQLGDQPTDNREMPQPYRLFLQLLPLPLLQPLFLDRTVFLCPMTILMFVVRGEPSLGLALLLVWAPRRAS